MSLSFPHESTPREWELHMTIAGTALAAVLIPPFFAAAFFKVFSIFIYANFIKYIIDNSLLLRWVILQTMDTS